MAYDNDINKTILLDGYHRQDRTPLKGDVWMWDGNHWDSIYGNSPRVTFGSAVAYDATRKKIVLFGGMLATGTDDGSVINETWEWDTKTGWKKQDVSHAPSPRAYHSMAYDSDRGKTVLFGGVTDFSKAAFNETWEWNGNKWEKIKTANSAAGLCDFAMVYDNKRKRVVLFSGQPIKADQDASRKDSGETWEWDGKIWQKLSGKGPSPRVQHRMAFDTKKAVALLYGGNCRDTTGSGYAIM